MKKGITFVDAQEMHKKHPKTFGAPTLKELKSIKVKDIVKISCENERFWVIITKTDKNKIWGKIDNDLIYTDRHGLNLGDKVIFDQNNIYSIFN